MQPKIFCFLFLLTVSLTAQTSTYFDQTGEEKNSFKATVYLKDKSYFFSLINENYQLKIESSSKIISSFIMTQPDIQKRVEGFQKDSLVYMKYWPGKKGFKSKQFKLSTVPWIQNFILLDYYMEGLPQKFEFWLFSIDEFKFRHMIIKKKETETIQLDHLEFPAVKYALNVKGIPGFLWTAHIWLDAETGKFLKYKGLSGGPGSAQKVFRKQFILKK